MLRITSTPPRTSTTLVEKILGSHKQAASDDFSAAGVWLRPFEQYAPRYLRIRRVLPWGGSIETRA